MVLNIIFWALGVISSCGLFFATATFKLPDAILFAILYLILIPIFYVLWFAIYALILFIYTLFINKNKKLKTPSKAHYALLKSSLHVLNKLARIKIHTSNLDILPKDSRYLVVTNHISNFDPLIFIDVFKERLICVTKPENEKIPLAGAFIYKSGFIKINRESAFKAVESINLAAKYLKEDVANIFICPEGTRSKSGELLSFHPGSFKIATKTNVPIVVCSIKNANKVRKNFPLKRTHIYLDIIQIITPEQYAELSTVELSYLAENIIRQNLK